MITRKGKVKCDSCSMKQKHANDFLVLLDLQHDDGSHFCSWDCLADEVAAILAADLEPSDFSD
jgi:hypothetical protein